MSLRVLHGNLSVFFVFFPLDKFLGGTRDPPCTDVEDQS